MSVQQNLMSIPFVDLKAQHKAVATEVEEAIADVIQNTAFILGSAVSRFEEAFAKYCNVGYAVGVSSGTAALEIALRVFDIGADDEVITVTNTFIATALAITYAGANPVFVDIDPKTYLIDIEKLEEAITDKTKAIIPVHLYGQTVDMDPIMELARQHNLVVIEDACQAHGAKYKGIRVGGLGHAAAFSFYPSKNLGAYGDAGMVVTNDKKAAEKMKLYSNVGQNKKYHHAIKGYNHRLDNLQAAILEVKLKYLDKWNGARQRSADMYNELIPDNSKVIKPVVADFADAVWHLYVVRVKNRDSLMAQLEGMGVGVGIHYPIPIHLQPAYKELGYKLGDFPISEQCADEIISLPMYPELTPDYIEYVVDGINIFSV